MFGQELAALNNGERMAGERMLSGQLGKQRRKCEQLGTLSSSKLLVHRLLERRREQLLERRHDEQGQQRKQLELEHGELLGQRRRQLELEHGELLGQQRSERLGRKLGRVQRLAWRLDERRSTFGLHERRLARQCWRLSEQLMSCDGKLRLGCS